MKKTFMSLVELTVLTMVFTQIASAALTNRYVIKNNAGSAVPYDSQVNAASNIQIAIDYAKNSETVLVYAATYDAGGIANWPAGALLTNRVAITKAITVMSVSNDPANTIIKGAWDPATTNGPAAIRCVYMAAGSTLVGFTLTNGATEAYNIGYGGGMYAKDRTVIVSNCVITGNSAGRYGAGTYNGTFYNCTIIGNLIWSQGTGGGAYNGTLYNCLIAKNSGVGTHSSTNYNCLIIGNYLGYWGGGAYLSTLYNCTIVGNKSSDLGGGTYGSTLYNCIIYSNTGAVGSLNYYSNCILTNCCTTPTNSAWVSGDGNITNNPMFVASGAGFGTNLVAGNYHLSGSSPCINAGTNGAWTTNYAGYVDLDGRPRVRYGRVDIGCYEYVSKGAIISIR